MIDAGVIRAASCQEQQADDGALPACASQALRDMVQPK
jgi:hypothetical protein